VPNTHSIKLQFVVLQQIGGYNKFANSSNITVLVCC